MAIVKDETQAHGTKYTWPHVPVKVDGHTQGIHLLKISCAPKLVTLSFAVYGMLTPLPFDRGKMVSSLSLHCPHIASLPISPWPSSSEPCAPVPTSIKSTGRRLLLSSGPLLPMESDHMPMGSDNMHWLYLAQAIALQRNYLPPDPSWIWITQESHILFSTSSSHRIWRYTCF